MDSDAEVSSRAISPSNSPATTHIDQFSNIPIPRHGTLAIEDCKNPSDYTPTPFPSQDLRAQPSTFFSDHFATDKGDFQNMGQFREGQIGYLASLVMSFYYTST